MPMFTAALIHNIQKVETTQFWQQMNEEMKHTHTQWKVISPKIEWSFDTHYNMGEPLKRYGK